jgi:hypothetical protein
VRAIRGLLSSPKSFVQSSKEGSLDVIYGAAGFVALADCNDDLLNIRVRLINVDGPVFMTLERMRQLAE